MVVEESAAARTLAGKVAVEVGVPQGWSCLPRCLMMYGPSEEGL